jgi:hypothetical protein
MSDLFEPRDFPESVPFQPEVVENSNSFLEVSNEMPSLINERCLEKDKNLNEKLISEEEDEDADDEDEDEPSASANTVYTSMKIVSENGAQINLSSYYTNDGWRVLVNELDIPLSELVNYINNITQNSIAEVAQGEQEEDQGQEQEQEEEQEHEKGQVFADP